jgi:hypothetical protein
MLRGIGAIRLASRLTAVCCCIVLACVVLASGTDAAQQTLDQQTLVWMQAVLNNWEAVCRRDLRIPAQPLPWIVFYDEDLAWHLHPETRRLPQFEWSIKTARFGCRTANLFLLTWQNRESPRCLMTAIRRYPPSSSASVIGESETEGKVFCRRQGGVLRSRRHLPGDGRVGHVGAVPDGTGAGAVGRGVADDVHHAL